MLYVCSYFTLKDMHNSQSLRRILFIGNGGGGRGGCAFSSNALNEFHLEHASCQEKFVMR